METQLILIYLHLGTVIPAFLIGSYLMVVHKGTPLHKKLGKLYMLLMLSTALIVLFISAVVGPTLLNHFGFIHLFILLVIYSVITAYRAIKVGNVTRHKSTMIGLYVGGLLITGSLALMPGRMLGDLLF